MMNRKHMGTELRSLIFLFSHGDAQRNGFQGIFVPKAGGQFEDGIGIEMNDDIDIAALHITDECFHARRRRVGVFCFLNFRQIIQRTVAERLIKVVDEEKWIQ